MSNRHLGGSSGTEKTSTEIMKLLLRSWFSSARSTEAMMCGTMNENPVLHVIASKSFVKTVHECGILETIYISWISCYPNAVVTIETQAIGLTETPQTQLASVKIKTSVAPSSLDRALGHSSHDAITCTDGDDKLVKGIPKNNCNRHWVSPSNMSYTLQQARSQSCSFVLFQCLSQ